MTLAGQQAAGTTPKLDERPRDSQTDGAPKKARQNESCLILGTFDPPTQAQLGIIQKILDDGLNIVIGIQPGPKGHMDFGKIKQTIRTAIPLPFATGRMTFILMPRITEIFHGRGSRIRIRR